MVDISQNTTVADLKKELQKIFKISSPIRIFFHRNQQEVPEDTDLKSFVDLVVLVTKDGKGLTWDKTVGIVEVPPGPPSRPFIGNAMDFLPNMMVASPRLRSIYGNIFQVKIPLLSQASSGVFLADPVLADIVLQNPDVWGKLHMKAMEFRKSFGDGLFTSDDDEEIWQIAHRILLPAFSQQGMKQYFQLIVETASELSEKLMEISEKKFPVDANDWCARFTFEVIGKVAFGIPFHSFEERPAFLKDLEESLNARTLSFISRMIPGHPTKKKSAIARDRIFVFLRELISKKRQELETNPETRSKKDVSTLMLLSKDPQTGKSLPDENIVSQALTFLVAGHDSTSTALTSLLYNLSANPEIEAKVLQEIDEVVGDKPLTLEHLSKLPYCTKVIKENLRMLPPAANIVKTATKNTTLGKYYISAGTPVLISIWATHFNPEVWPDPDVFDPERHTPELIKSRPMSAWLPFSYGPRACIGQQLSLLEQYSFLALIYKNYSFRLHHTANIHITFPLFAKPNGVIMTVTSRKAAAAAAMMSASAPGAGNAATAHIPVHLSVNTTKAKDYPILILYGSNMETCTEYSRQLEERARTYGFPVLRCTLDEFVANNFHGLSPDGKSVVIFVTSTYNGEPPDNALNFRTWISGDSEEVSKVWRGVRYAVFGAGNSQWRTYQVFPVFVDQHVERAGGVRLCETGRGDANEGSVDDTFTEWQAKLWLQLLCELGLNNNSKQDEGFSFNPITYRIVDQKPEISELRNLLSDFAKLNNAFLAKVVANRELRKPRSDGQLERSTRHVEFELAEGITYTAGDHLAVFPINPPSVVQKAAATLGVDLNTVLVLEKDRKGNKYPFSTPITVEIVLSRAAELQAPATRGQIAFLATKTECPPEKQALQRLSSLDEDPSSSTSYENYIQKSRRTVLELLDQYKSVKITLGEFVGLSNPIKPRYYSISSSSFVYPKVAHITVGVVEGLSPTGRLHKGLASTFLAGLEVGDHALVLVKKSSFRLPQDLSLPVIMIGPGTGVAPMRGFIQERKASKATGETVLVYGCRDEFDYIYRTELESYRDDGTLSLLDVAYSRIQSDKVYVQHKVVENGAYLYKLLLKGAYVYICGDARVMAPDVRKAFVDILQQYGDMNSVLAEEFVASLRHTQRYNEDVWASTT